MVRIFKRPPASLRPQPALLHYTLFPSELGWMGLLGSAATVHRLTFGHKSATAARKALGAESKGSVRDELWFGELVERLQAYAGGAREAFLDVTVSYDGFTDFQRTVVEECRHIPPGTALSYGDLAKAAGRPGAARAVGNVMRANRVPLIVPCHRVVASGGKLHNYSAAGGQATKRKLLQMELHAWVWEGVRHVVE
ncbi:MAG: hypothetical protein C0483_18360 [Pirellula sp.]|nr:hypothetical protein [Pirellula sp.]